MSVDQNSLIRFVQSCPPSLDSGDYKLHIEHQVQSPGQETFYKEAKFSVQGPRFRLESADIYSFYPPANHEGDFSNCLPHIILTRKTLPWERALDGQEKHLPWLALIVLGEDELSDGWPGVSQTKKVQDLVNPPSNIFHPVLKLETGQKLDDDCKIVDLPLQLFYKIFPKKNELSYLCHARLVDMQHKEISEQKRDGWFSTVVSNRFPKVSSGGIKNIVHLVSLEGFQDYLPGGSKEFAQNIQAVRLVSLAEWSFIGKQEPFSFGHLAKNLTIERLQLPVDGKAENQAEQMVERMLEQGFTAISHTFRHGEKTISWYRGPLVPLKVTEKSMKSIPCADQALRYDSEMGLFDISYAAAWQIGRLLALQNNHFASALYNFRKENHQTLRTKQNTYQIYHKLTSCVNQEDLPGMLRDMREVGDKDFYKVFLRYLSGDFLKQILGECNNEPLLGELADHTGLQEHVEQHHGLISQETLASINGTGDELTENLLSHLINREED